MDLMATLARRFFIPVYDWRDGVSTGSAYRELLATQYLPGDQIREMQWTKVKALLAHAYARIPFYRERFQAFGAQPGDITDWDAFTQFPLLTKDDLRANLDTLIGEGFDRQRLFHKRTGGSTGVPVHLYWDRSAREFKGGLTRRHDEWAGYVRGTRRAALWGDTEKSLSLKERIRRVTAERTVYLDTLLMDEAHLDRFIDQVRRFRPENLIGHGHSLFFLAQVYEERGVEDVPFRSIISTAETLSPEEREVVERVFGPILFDRYGCEEVSIIASECEERDGLHVAAEGLFVEVLGGSGEEPGRVVITDLVNRAMPFIRYELGDLATTKAGACRCGRGLPRLGRVMGRTSDILKTPDGRSVSGISILDTFMIHIPGVKQAQLIQEKPDELRILVVTDPRYCPQTQASIGAVIREVFGDAMRWSVEVVETIPRTARGKYQFTISRIDAGDDV